MLNKEGGKDNMPAKKKEAVRKVKKNPCTKKSGLFQSERTQTAEGWKRTVKSKVKKGKK